MKKIFIRTLFFIFLSLPISAGNYYLSDEILFIVFKYMENNKDILFVSKKFKESLVHNTEKLVLKGEIRNNNMKLLKDLKLKSLVIKCISIPEEDGISGRCFVDISKISTLSELKISGPNKISDKGMPFLAKMTNLKSLCLHDSKELTSKGLQELSKLTNLNSLSILLRGKVYDDLGFLSGLTNLRELGLLENMDDCICLYNVDLENLSYLTNLSRLHLGVSFEDDQLKHISNLINLRVIKLDKKDIKKLDKYLTNLK